MVAILVSKVGYDGIPYNVNEVYGQNTKWDGEKTEADKFQGQYQEAGKPSCSQGWDIIPTKLGEKLFEWITFKKTRHPDCGGHENGIQEQGIGHHMRKCCHCSTSWYWQNSLEQIVSNVHERTRNEESIECDRQTTSSIIKTTNGKPIQNPFW